MVALSSFWFTTKGVIVALGAVVLLVGSIVLWGPDNPIEELVEDVIEDETGLDVDITYDTDEVHDAGD